MSIDMNHFIQKRKEFGMYCVWWVSEPEPVGRRRGSPPYAAAGRFTLQASLSAAPTGFYHEASASVCCCSKSNAAPVYYSDPPRCGRFLNRRNTFGRFYGFFRPSHCATEFSAGSVYAGFQAFVALCQMDIPLFH